MSVGIIRDELDATGLRAAAAASRDGCAARRMLALALVLEGEGYRLMEDLGTKPSVYYLPPVNRNFKFEDGLKKEEPAEKKS